MLKSPALLILDEATAALDPAGEAEVWAAVGELRGRTTVLAISHQPALLAVADRTYLVEAGTARELPARPGAAPDPGRVGAAGPEVTPTGRRSVPAQ
jgi:ABC-type transport system involved in cytochrome bd biosynthesis fused ATPase/permease subunit